MHDSAEAEKFTIADVGDFTADAAIGVEVQTSRGRRLLVVSRHGDSFSVFVNSCPHTGARLDLVPGYFVNDTGGHLQCQSHGALFDHANGVCVSGPCTGDTLLAVPHTIENGALVVRIDADLPLIAGAAPWPPAPGSD